MSHPSDGNPNTASSSRAYDQGASSSSSSYSRSHRNSSFPPLLTIDKKGKVEESDEDLFTVPDVEARPPIDPSKNNTSEEVLHHSNTCTALPGKRRRGRNPVDREYRRLKRLLRNRVSAQQARERKKVYVNDLESRAKELHDRNSKLEEKISTLINENTMLRKVLMNTRPKVDESIEPKHDQLGKI